ncbi:hypothetical protein RR48_03534 [Papilio machaon]|uniref:Uncharacterized protein n=1 Tax=Papilio machaon TaxID=76193 RepID=A0A0N1IDZ2_PAPMA|nr:hypothetical protein RR48_03534 [Papilio machaon]
MNIASVSQTQRRNPRILKQIKVIDKVRTCLGAHLDNTKQKSHRETRLSNQLIIPRTDSWREGLAGWTALHIAARRGDARLCSALLQRGASPRARSMAGRTPRAMAARTAARHAFAALPTDDSDTDTDSEDDGDEMFDSDTESLFEKLKESANLINVA